MIKEQYAEKEIKVDKDGFLIDTEEWDEDIARSLAKGEGVEELTEEMMEILKFMRTYYKKFNAFPILNYVCKNIHQPRECISEEFINPEKAWKIAGLPKLDNIHFVSVDGKHYLLEECC
ncbi:MAG: TusE/DsrC/DsvC family sulfur relay protein [Thermodesulfobacteriota bacterium]